MLRYLYTKNENLDDIAEKLLVAAHKYEILDLKKFCEKSLCFKVNLDNSVKLLQIANSCNAWDLEDYVLDFITKNRKKNEKLVMIKYQNYFKFEFKAYFC